MDNDMLTSHRRKRFREYLARNQCIQPATVFDAVSARIADILGFEVGMLPGSVASAATLAAPDLTMITLTELAERARQITRASSLSLLVDADHGYGNALNVTRTVEEMEAAGVSALTIEDTLLPIPYGQPKSGRIIPVQEMEGKLRAALKARHDPSLVIIGRTGSLQSESLESAVARVRAYTSAGVDAIFLTGVKSLQQLEAVHAATPLPLILGSTPSSLDDQHVLASLGVRIALKGHLVFQMAVQAIYDALKHQKDGKPRDALRNKAASQQLMELVLNHDKYSRWQRDFLGADEP